jgi:non-ribosomal peptide synthetase component F
MTLLAAYQTLLYRYSGQEDISVGSPIANRNRAEIENLIGCFLNVIVLRTDMSGNPSFRELLSRVREVTTAAYAHQDVPYEKVIDELAPARDLSHAQLIQATFTFQNSPMDSVEMSDLTMDPFEIDSGMVEYDVSLMISGDASGLGGLMIYNRDLFDASTIRQMLNHFQMILEEAVEDPEVRLLRIRMQQDRREEVPEAISSLQSVDAADQFTFVKSEV